MCVLSEFRVNIAPSHSVRRRLGWVTPSVQLTDPVYVTAATLCAADGRVGRLHSTLMAKLAALMAALLCFSVPASLQEGGAEGGARDELHPLLSLVHTAPHSLSLMIRPHQPPPDTMIRYSLLQPTLLTLSFQPRISAHAVLTFIQSFRNAL